ncbi:MAG: phage major tail tube protein [Desulfovibrio sp.]|jgi:P2 family phage contractile tail tube protein|nr:phage major tail tube protein [Desulfovibrio sp.]
MSQAISIPVTNPIPALLTNAKIYRDGADQLGVGTVELPNFEFMTESIAGLGIGGEMDMPVVGHFKSMSIKITWNTVNDNTVGLLLPQAHHLDVRGSVQEYDAGAGTFVNKAVKVVVRAIPKTSGIGKFEPGKKMDPETELEVSYLKLWLGGVERVEVDKFNLIFRVNGMDSLADIRANLGM